MQRRLIKLKMMLSKLKKRKKKRRNKKRKKRRKKRRKSLWPKSMKEHQDKEIEIM